MNFKEILFKVKKSKESFYMMRCKAYGSTSASASLSLLDIERRDMGPLDILVEILFCGVCHSDLHIAKNEWGHTQYPVVPGHEIIGKIIGLGTNVQKHKLGDIVGIGCIVGSCGNCPSCSSHLEQYCDQGFTLVFNSTDKHSGITNFGGFSKQIVVSEKYAVNIPSSLQQHLPRVAPLLCAGITTYSPLSNWKVSNKTKCAIIGLGGLGHMALKLAKAMQAHTTIFTSSSSKILEALRLGADECIVTSDKDSMKQQEGKYDFILNTISSDHNLQSFLSLLKRDGSMCMVGLPGSPYRELCMDSLIHKRLSLCGSLIGSIKETEEMLNFCAQHNI
ncbi:MAG: NAD(P)-dependent alcohol dehydrogenase, partial [Chlamydiae bacterium]|nr:NAD(P)-dependent alcohol dehydrogenase [Chlamydiota bacterium]